MTHAHATIASAATMKKILARKASWHVKLEAQTSSKQVLNNDQADKYKCKMGLAEPEPAFPSWQCATPAGHAPASNPTERYNFVEFPNMFLL